MTARVILGITIRQEFRSCYAAARRLLARYYEDHPELADSRTSVSDFAAVSLAAQEEVDRRVQPVLARFDDQLERQQSMVDRYRFLSPAIVAQASLFDLAGTSGHRYEHFLKLVDGFHREWFAHLVPKIVHREKLTAEDIDRLPRFQFLEEPSIDVAESVALGLTGLIVPTVLIGFVLTRVLRRFPVAG
jgi:ABC-2 type transport system permease protein